MSEPATVSATPTPHPPDPRLPTTRQGTSASKPAAPSSLSYPPTAPDRQAGGIAYATPLQSPPRPSAPPTTDFPTPPAGRGFWGEERPQEPLPPNPPTRTPLPIG